MTSILGFKKRNLILFILMLSFMITVSEADPKANDDILKAVNENSSNWAKKELKLVVERELYTKKIIEENLRDDITREEFAELVMILYTKFTSDFSESKDKSPFVDTVNKEVVKAFELGIVKGKSKTNFDPYGYLSREEFATMLYRMLKISFEKANLNYTMKALFDSSIDEIKDEKNIANWSRDAMLFLYENGIIKGSKSKLMPRGRLSREMALLMTVRTDTQFYMLNKNALKHSSGEFINKDAIVLNIVTNWTEKELEKLRNLATDAAFINEKRNVFIKIPHDITYLKEKINDEKTKLFKFKSIELNLYDMGNTLSDKNLKEFIKKRYSSGSKYYGELSGSDKTKTEFKFKDISDKNKSQNLEKVLANINIARDDMVELNLKLAALRNKKSGITVFIEMISLEDSKDKTAIDVVNSFFNHMVKACIISDK